MPAVVAFYCGDLAGNYFLARRLLDEEYRQRSEAPAATHYLAITDIFEALTASDRPYKPAKTLSQSLGIMKKMAEEGHIDPDLFRIFLDSGVGPSYAERFLDPAQRDTMAFDTFMPQP